MAGRLNGAASGDGSQAIRFTRRALVLGGFQGGVGLLLAARMGWLSIFEKEKYDLLAESNRVSLKILEPRRGWIVDRTGKPLAMNRPDFRIDLTPAQAADIERTLAELAKILALTPEQLAEAREAIKAADGQRPVEIANGVSWQQFAEVNVRLPDLPGVEPVRGYARHYPTGPSVGHLLGYVGAASREQYLEKRDPLLIAPGFKIGKDNLEKVLEDKLTGKAGAARVEVTAHGRPVRELATIPATPGQTVRLTVDAGLQDYAARRIGPESGSVVVIDTVTGDILAMTSMPSFDPNSFSDGISNDEWTMLREHDHLPLLNKTLQGLYPPGSTLKPVTALALLEAGITPDAAVVCNGRYNLGGSYFHCWKRGGHGVVSMRKAIYQSCDVYFYHFTRLMGVDRLAGMARKLGLGAEYELPVVSQRYGTVPDQAWKKRKYHKDWTPGETLSAAIGQGYFLANPLQLAVMIARIASGRALNPHLLLGGKRQAEGTLAIDPAHLLFVREAMSEVVNGSDGTAMGSRLRLPDVKMAGKTGTAQVRRISMAERRHGVISNEQLPWKFRDHALFIGFAPVEAPRYAAAVVIEHGSGGSKVAAPIARDVLTYLYDREAAMKALLALEEQWGGDPVTRLARHAEQYQAAKNAPPAQPAAPTQTAAATAPEPE